MTHLLQYSPVYSMLSGRLLESDNRLGFVASASGTGKSTILTHLGLLTITEGHKVLHISLQNPQQHVRLRYDDVLRTLQQATDTADSIEVHKSIEQNRLVHAHLDQGYSIEQCEDTLNMFGQFLDFHPQIVLVDATEQLTWTATELERWQTLAETKNCWFWFTVESVPEDALSVKTIQIFDLPSGTTLRFGDKQVDLHSHNLCLRKTRFGHNQGTLFSGGAVGAEATFGEVASRYGWREVHFTFPGHEQHRSVGSTELSPTELSLGSTSLAYVSKLLNRNWTRSPRLQKVLQVQWHLVSHADQIFVVGQIQPDNTVHGGTGWSVELAKRWGKSIWVYDQQQGQWFTWSGLSWTPQVPTITSRNVAASGTRYLNHNGKQAIEELFKKSFVENDSTED